MTTIDFIRPSDPAWGGLLSEALCYDFYHLPAYHEMAEARGEGEAVMCVYRDGEFTIAMPLLLRWIKDVQGIADCLALDATSVYGYPGPIVSRPPPAEVVQRFQNELKRALEERNVVSVFSRLHPLLPQLECLQGLGWLQPAGSTTSINLRLPQQEQRARYRRNHKHGINKLQRLGVVCFADPDFQHLDGFIGLYHETMQRVGAGRYYFFDRAYFDQLRGALGQRLHLYVCCHGGRAICGGLFVHTGNIVQYHLGGTDGRYLKWAPMKLLFDTVRRDCSGGDVSWFHLGGGLGAQRDSLFHFKKGFGGDEHVFVLWKWVVQEAAYEELCQRRFGAEQNASSVFFPRYRMAS
jgi:Acetyltransferase (GNAT) domain